MKFWDKVTKIKPVAAIKQKRDQHKVEKLRCRGAIVDDVVIDIYFQETPYHNRFFASNGILYVRSVGENGRYFYPLTEEKFAEMLLRGDEVLCEKESWGCNYNYLAASEIAEIYKALVDKLISNGHDRTTSLRLAKHSARSPYTYHLIINTNRRSYDVKLSLNPTTDIANAINISVAEYHSIYPIKALYIFNIPSAVDEENVEDYIRNFIQLIFNHIPEDYIRAILDGVCSTDYILSAIDKGLNSSGSPEDVLLTCVPRAIESVKYMIETHAWVRHYMLVAKWYRYELTIQQALDARIAINKTDLYKKYPRQREIPANIWTHIIEVEGIDAPKNNTGIKENDAKESTNENK